MKKFITSLFLFLITVIVAEAQDMQRSYPPQQTKLSISSYLNSGNLRVSIDGETYNINRQGDNSDFILTNLSVGNHNIKLWQMPIRRPGSVNSNAIRVIYQGNVYLRNGYYTDIYINRFNHIMKDEQLISGYDAPDPNYPGTNQPHYPGYNPAMSAENFASLKSTLRNESFDNSRMNIAKQAAASNYFSAAQVKEIMQLFSFDNSRLDIAKTFYPRVTDKQNYFMVNDAFSFSSSKDSLAEFLRQNP